MDNLNVGIFFLVVSVIAFITFIILLAEPFGKGDLQDKFLIGSIITFVIAIIIGMIFTSIPSDYEKQQDAQQQEENITKRRLCSEKTNTYYRCSWSITEDRCVCKQR